MRDRGEKWATIASLKNLNEATVRTIYKNKDQIQAHGSYTSNPVLILSIKSDLRLW